MRTELLDYDLPPARIAQRPAGERPLARLLGVRPSGFEHRTMADWPELVPNRSLVVLNDTRVLKGRLSGRRWDTGGRVELLLLRGIAGGGDGERWLALVRARGKLQPGCRLVVGDAVATVSGRQGDAFELEFQAEGGVHRLADGFGLLPLPPYIQRAADAEDEDRYQTVYGEKLGSVAAPTAGLHLTRAALARLEERGIELGYVTLHVGAGTFLPVRTEDLDQHPMHSELCEVSTKLVRQLERARQERRPVVAVGTTVVRALESACSGGELCDFSGHTQLLIQPGYEFRVVDALLTNFHAPRTTLLALVAAFIGLERMRAAYEEALRHEYRFLSYGDAMWISERAS